MPSQDTEGKRDSMKHVVWPPKNIWTLIESVSAPTAVEYINKVLPDFLNELPRQVFILLTVALDDFLGRKGHTGTLGQRFYDIRKKINMKLPTNVDAGIQELIQRRNDVAHGRGKVSSHYVSGDKYPMLLQSSGIQKYGIPAIGSHHKFDTEYLYDATSNICAFCKVLS